jgi:hypothetical protein
LLTCGGLAIRLACRGLQTKLQNRDRIEAGLFVILNVGHIEEVSTRDDSGRDAFKQGITPLKNLEPLDRPTITRQYQPNNPRRHDPVLYRNQRAAMKIETINRREA